MRNRDWYDIISQEIDTLQMAYQDQPDALRALEFLALNLADSFNKVDLLFKYDNFIRECGFEVQDEEQVDDD